MVLRDGNVSSAFEKRAPCFLCSITNANIHIIKLVFIPEF